MEPSSPSKTLALWALIFSACFYASSPARTIIKKTRPMFNLISANNCSGGERDPINFVREVKIIKQGRDLVVINLEIFVGHNIFKPQGVYKMINGTIDGSKMMDMIKPMPHQDFINYYWMYRIAMLSNKMRAFCGDFLIKIDLVKS